MKDFDFLKNFYRQTFYRSVAFRRLVGPMVTFLFKQTPLQFSHFFLYRENTLGPIQRDEALFLFSLIRVCRPKILVEFGFLQGQGSFNFLQAMDPKARLFSYEIDPKCLALAGPDYFKDARFQIVAKSQTEFEPQDVGNEPVDFAFFDASHRFHENCITFRRLLPSLAKDGILAIHDTGTWSRKQIPQLHQKWRTSDGGWLDRSSFAHQIGERRFVNFVLKNYPKFSVIHLHSTRAFRHGLTLIQRRYRLAIPKGKGSFTSQRIMRRVLGD